MWIVAEEVWIAAGEDEVEDINMPYNGQKHLEINNNIKWLITN